MNLPYIKSKNLKALEKFLQKTFDLNSGTEDSAGLDLFTANIDNVWFAVNEVKKIPTGISVEIPKNHFGLVTLRPVIKNFCLTNGVGIINADCRGEIILSLRNLDDFGPIVSSQTKGTVIHPGTKIAQLVIVPYTFVTPIETSKLTPTIRGTGGFGSTGA